MIGVLFARRAYKSYIEEVNSRKDDVLKKCLLCHEDMDLDSSREILDVRWHYSECYFNKGSFMKKYPPVTKDLDKKQYTCPYMADGCTQRLTCLMVYMEFCLHIAISHKETRKFLSEDSTSVIVIVLKTLYPGEEPIN